MNLKLLSLSSLFCISVLTGCETIAVMTAPDTRQNTPRAAEERLLDETADLELPPQFEQTKNFETASVKDSLSQENQLFPTYPMTLDERIQRLEETVQGIYDVIYESQTQIARPAHIKEPLPILEPEPKQQMADKTILNILAGENTLDSQMKAKSASRPKRDAESIVNIVERGLTPSIIKNIRYGRRGNGVRIVFDMTEPLVANATIDNDINILSLYFPKGDALKTLNSNPKNPLVKAVSVTPQDNGGAVYAFSLDEKAFIQGSANLKPAGNAAPFYRYYIDLSKL